MSTNTKIEWTDHTVNTHWGCAKVSRGCKNCYAETLANRWPHSRGLWKPGGNRLELPNWKADLKTIQNRARKLGTVQTVFMNSMSDLFEGKRNLIDRDGNPTGRTTIDLVAELMAIIPTMPELVFLVLTKRPELISEHLDVCGVTPQSHPNLWIGTSASTQAEANEVLPALKAGWEGKKFLSLEPLVEVLWLHHSVKWLDWVIVGGESGPKATPLHPLAVERIRRQCREAKIPFFFKQWGTFMHWMRAGDLGWLASNGSASDVLKPEFWEKRGNLKSKYKERFDWDNASNDIIFERVGKAKAGRKVAFVLEYNGRPVEHTAPIQRNGKSYMKSQLEEVLGRDFFHLRGRAVGGTNG